MSSTTSNSTTPSAEELDKSFIIARENGKQEANLNVGYHCDPLELNMLHPIWKESSEEQENKRQTKVNFNDKIFSKTLAEIPFILEEDTDFSERGERAICKAVKIVEAACDPSKTIIPILASIGDEEILNKIDNILVDIIKNLENGKRYSFSNSSSLKVNPSSGALFYISRAYTIFAFFTGRPSIFSKDQELTCTTKPLLVRQGPRSVYCVPK